MNKIPSWETEIKKIVEYITVSGFRNSKYTQTGENNDQWAWSKQSQSILEKMSIKSNTVQ